MPWRVTGTTDGQHEGEVLESIDQGNLITFADGDVISIDEVMVAADGYSAVVFSPNYQIKLTKEM